MAKKYVIHPQPAENRFPPPGKYLVTRGDLCINCGKCAVLCLYEVHRRSPGDYRRMDDPRSFFCKRCLSCIQECPREALSISLDPVFEKMGDRNFTPDIIAALIKQAESGQTPVSGGGYGGLFAGCGFDAMWTDMSEIVRPTRDGIHGREYISTAVNIGRKMPDVREVSFDEGGNPRFNIPPTVEINLPILFDTLPLYMKSPGILEAICRAASILGTFAIVERQKINPALSAYESNIIETLNVEDMSWKEIKEAAEGRSIMEMSYSSSVSALPGALKKVNPDLIVMARIEGNGDIAELTGEMYHNGIDVIHVRNEANLPETIAAAHRRLVSMKIRDSVTIVASGAIAEASHLPKSIILGADAVAVDIPLLLAMECTLCKKCLSAPPEKCPRDLEKVETKWAGLRIINLTAAWHNQLLEILGAMGMREVERLRGELGRAMFKEQLDEEFNRRKQV
jgi:ferredoxin